MLLYVAVVAGSWLAARLPLPVAYFLADGVGLAGYVISPRARRAIQYNLAVVLNDSNRSRAVRGTALAAFRNTARNWIDSLRLASLSTQEVERRVNIDGWEHVEAARREGQGVILIGLHLGNLDTVVQIMAARGYSVTVPVEPMRPAALFERMQKLRKSHGVNTIPTNRSGRTWLRSLDENEIVGMLADRNLSKGGVEVQFFGRAAKVSKGPAWLISRSSAPVVLGAAVRQPKGNFKGRVTILEVQRTGNAVVDQRVNAQLIIQGIEAWIRAYPAQWSMFSPVWPTH